ncbi:hypothetical protein LEP1GSC188_1900 [Leptospira weilii serovar Topaz str. LT2116]|uniref:Uncharacterized protein n=1 Tax=Leptospira weilii serovar Topaz str. LT2116 TaxID=1088540 RepID=M3FI18_9LEPT|nr:hypothetical protein LEP1GSC188_1900 [Leptospira weilii serovar Topaz str. LT2116]
MNGFVTSSQFKRQLELLKNYFSICFYFIETDDWSSFVYLHY